MQSQGGCPTIKDLVEYNLLNEFFYHSASEGVSFGIHAIMYPILKLQHFPSRVSQI